MGFLDKLIKNTVKQVTNEAERDARNAANQAVGNAVNNALGGLFGTNRPAGTANTAPAAEAYSEALPTATDAGTYNVWYYVKGDILHTDTEPVCVEVTIDKAEQEIKAQDVEGSVGESGKVIKAEVTGEARADDREQE